MSNQEHHDLKLKVSQSLKETGLQQQLTSHNIPKITCIRLIVAMIQADEVFDAGEAEYLSKLSAELELSDEEQEAVQQDIISPRSFEELTAELVIPENPEDRKFLINQVWPVAIADGVLDGDEAEFFGKLKDFLGVQELG